MVKIAAKPGIQVQPLVKAGSLVKVSLFTASSFTLDTEFCDPSHIKLFSDWMKAYSKGKFLPFPLPLPAGTFQGAVLRFLQSTPCGTVLSYQDVAKAVNNPRAARAIGNICRGNPFPLLIPCHRVIRSDGKIGCYTPDMSLKKELLQFEGVLTSD